MKLAMPIVYVRCPNETDDGQKCDAPLEVDVRQIKQPKGKNPASEDYKHGITGECYTECPKCHKWVAISYTYSGRGMLWGHGVPTPASAFEVADAIRNKTGYEVDCNLGDDPVLFNDGAETGGIDAAPSHRDKKTPLPVAPVYEDTINTRKQKMSPNLVQQIKQDTFDRKRRKLTPNLVPQLA